MTLSIYPVKAESRARDIKRKRFVLDLGAVQLHLTRDEVEILVDDAMEALAADSKPRKKKV